MISLHPIGLPCYAEKAALAFADESSNSSLHYSPPSKLYDSKVFSYPDLSTSKSEYS